MCRLRYVRSIDYFRKSCVIFQMILEYISNMHRYLRALIFSLIIWLLGYQVYGIEFELCGLNIEQILAPNAIESSVEVLENAAHLDAMLRRYPFAASIIDEQVTVALTEQPAQLSDTDESVAREEQSVSAITSQIFASKFSVDQSKTLLKPSEIDYDQESNQITKGLCHRLAQDAFRIANAHKNARTREATTCLCVVLRDEKNRPKKLVFHNSTGEMQPSMRKKADDLGYSIRNAYLAHAEVQLIDFLMHRAQQRTNEVVTTGQATKPKYTHILGMGCSKKHCQECNTFCKLFLGDVYVRFTAASEELSDEASMPVIEALAPEHEADLRMTIPRQYFKVVFEEEAIRSGSNRSPNYRLSGTMQQCIRDKCGFILNFTNPPV